MSMTFEVQGMKELQDELVKFPERLARRSLARATSTGAALVRDKARENARARGLYVTGTLVKGIRIKKMRTRNWRYEAVYEVYHSGKGWYGALHERGYNPGGGTTHVINPHLRPALDENVPTIIEVIKQRLAREIKVMRFEAATGTRFKKAFESQLAQY